MLFRIYLSRAVGAVGLGLLQLIMSVGGLALTVGVSGIRVTAMYLCAEELGLRRTHGLQRVLRMCVRCGLVMSFLAGFALIAGAGLLAQHWIGNEAAAPSLRLLGLFLPTDAIGAILTGYFIASGRVWQLVGVEALERGVSVFLTVLLLRVCAGGDLGRACVAIVAGGGIAGVVSVCLMARICVRAVPKPDRDVHIPVLRRIIHMCVPLALGDYFRSALTAVNHALIPRGLRQYARGADGPMAEYGTIHGMVFPVIFFPTAFLYALVDLLIPELSRCRVRKKNERIRALTDHCFRMLALFACACAGTLHLFAPPLGQLLFHSDQAAFFIALFAPLTVILYLDAITDGLLKGLGQQVHCVRCNTLTSALEVVGLMILLPRLGVMGYFLCFAATRFLNFLLSIARLLKVTAYRLPVGFCIRLLLCFGACIAVFRPVPGLFLPAFACTLAATRTVTRADLRWLRDVIRAKQTGATSEQIAVS